MSKYNRQVNKLKFAMYQANARSKSADLLSSLRKMNNDSYLDKKVIVSRLVYVIYFLLYLLILVIAGGTGMVSTMIINGFFVIGLIMLVGFMYSTGEGSLIKIYGDISMKFGKEATKGILTTVAPQKTCPERCVQKTVYGN